MSATKFYHVTNYIADVIMWPKFDNSGISSISNLNYIRVWLEKPQILKGGLGFSSIILDGHYLWPWNLDQCCKKVEILRPQRKFY